MALTRRSLRAMNPDRFSRPAAARLFLWWLLWVVTLVWLVAAGCLLIGTRAVAAGQAGLAEAIAAAAFAASCVARWLVLRRLRAIQSAFVLFVVGIALAEACGLVGVLLGAHRAGFLILGAVGIAQWMPFFARGYTEKADGS